MSADPNFYRVYALGLPGHLEGLVYAEGANWTHTPLAEWPESVTSFPPRALGIDFGFNDPATVTGMWDESGRRYAHELIYEFGLIDDDLVARLDRLFRDMGWPRTVPLVCDSARPDSIEKLKRSGFRAGPAKKDIVYGIGEVKSKPLIVSDESVNLIRELRNYRWAEKHGKIVDTPIDAYNHALDGLRYAIVMQGETPDSSRFLKYATKRR